MSYRVRGTAFLEPGLALCVTFQEENQVRIIVCCSRFPKVEEAAQYGYKLCHIFKCIDADEAWVMLAGNVTDCPSLDGSGPFKVPPEGGGLAVAS